MKWHLHPCWSQSHSLNQRYWTGHHLQKINWYSYRIVCSYKHEIIFNISINYIIQQPEHLLFSQTPLVRERLVP